MYEILSNGCSNRLTFNERFHISHGEFHHVKRWHEILRLVKSRRVPGGAASQKEQSSSLRIFSR